MWPRLCLSSSFLSMSLVAGQTVRTFVDDFGVEHSTDKSKPTFITGARNALFFYHHGNSTDQLVATCKYIRNHVLTKSRSESPAIHGAHRSRSIPSFYNWTDGINFNDGMRLNWDNETLLNAFAVDPTPEDIAFLRSIPTISSGCEFFFICLGNVDINKFQALNVKPDFWLLLDQYQGYVQNITEIMGKPPIYIDPLVEQVYLCLHQDGEWDVESKNADKCYFRSAIDVIKRTIKLAEFLGIELDDAEDQKTMCEAAMRFSNVAEAAQQRGIRAGRIFIEYSAVEDSAVILVMPIPPHFNPFTRTLEELGMPLLHPSYKFEYIDVYKSWFVNCREGQNWTSCNNDTLYNIDFWLLDSIPMNELTKLEFFEEFFPDKAILSGQFAHVPGYAGPFSYRTVARFLNDISNRLEKAQSLYPDQGCEDIDVTSKQHTSVANLVKHSTGKDGNVACFNRKYLKHAYCPADSIADSSAGISQSAQLLYLLVVSTWFVLL